MKKFTDWRKCDYCDKSSDQYKIQRSFIHEVNVCIKHYKQLQNHGKILTRTRFEPNIYHFYDDRVEIELYNKNKIYLAIIDKEDYHKVKNYKWHYSKGYAKTQEKGCQKKIRPSLHNVILNSMWIDHIDGNPLNNKKSNLRRATHGQNSMNQKVRTDNTSGHKGVYWSKNKQKWIMQITKNQKVITKGGFRTIEDAIKARKEAEEKYFGEFARKDYGTEVVTPSSVQA